MGLSCMRSILHADGYGFREPGHCVIGALVGAITLKINAVCDGHNFNVGAHVSGNVDIAQL